MNNNNVSKEISDLTFETETALFLGVRKEDVSRIYDGLKSYINEDFSKYYTLMILDKALKKGISSSVIVDLYDEVMDAVEEDCLMGSFEMESERIDEEIFIDSLISNYTSSLTTQLKKRNVQTKDKKYQTREDMEKIVNRIPHDLTFRQKPN